MKLLIYIIFLVNFSTQLFAEFQAVQPGYQWKFPRDHGSHPSFKTEWWYYTGHLTTSKNRTFGFELTFFRQAQSKIKKGSINNWDIDNIHLAHFAISDDQNKTFYFDSNISRPSFNMAYAQKNKLDVKNGNWHIKQQKNTVFLTASAPNINLDLELNITKGPILQGDNGYSLKSNHHPIASYYYSIPKLTGNGTLILLNNNHTVSAKAWFDHEFFSHNLATNTKKFGAGKIDGWDWFAIQLNNNTEIMIYQVRHPNRKNDYLFGTYIDTKGTLTKLSPKMFSITTLDHWKSKKTNITYPSKWKINIPSLNYNLIITPTFNDQELVFNKDNILNYWEGRSIVSGSHSGNAYVELAGYQQPASTD